MTQSFEAGAHRTSLRRAAWALGAMGLAGGTMASMMTGAGAATIGRGAPIISLSDVQGDGTIWVLAGHGRSRTMTKVDVTSGAFVTSESVSPRASAIAQSPNGDLALGTANGTSSAVVLYGGATGNYLSTVRVRGPVSALALGPTGQKVYVLEATKPNRTVFVFDQTHNGFPYQVGSDAVDIAPANGGADLWILRSGGSLDEMSFFPNQIVKHVNVGAPARSLAVSPDGSTIYVLTGAAGKAGQLKVFRSNGAPASGAPIPFPKGTNDLALSVDGATIYAAESGSRSGVVAAIPIGG